MTNDFTAGMFAGVGLIITGLAIFQIGVNIGIRNVLQLLDGQYPAAFQFINKQKTSLKILPWVIGNNND